MFFRYMVLRRDDDNWLIRVTTEIILSKELKFIAKPSPTLSQNYNNK